MQSCPYNASWNGRACVHHQQYVSCGGVGVSVYVHASHHDVRDNSK